MRSRKVSPGLDVIRTLISSERTRVPPVTAERSPPDSRITGADSPVMADSSTEATPSMTSPSPGTNSPTATRTMSPERNFELGSNSVFPSGRNFRASVSARALRKVSACALPRPSAMASAKFANNTVNHSHRVICNSNQKLPLCWKAFSSSTTPVITAPTSTTNITGFLICSRGFSFQKESTMAVRNIFRSVIEAFFACAVVIFSSKCLSRIHQQVFQNRPKTQRREERQRPDNQNHRDEKNGEKRASHGEGPKRFRHMLLGRKTSRNSKNRNDHKEAAK